MAIVKFSESTLRAKNKKGVLTPDADGYYTIVLGALNCYNSVGEYYVAKDSVKLFESSSHLMRRIKDGFLKAEVGHPKMDSSMSSRDWVNRVMSIEETNVCAHISDVWLDTTYGKTNPDCGNPDLIAIMGKICPSGAKGAALKASLDNVKENVAFSIRSITDGCMKNDRYEKTVTQIITWDYVTEPGIAVATKWATPTLEDHTLISIPDDLFVRVAREIAEDRISTESTREMISETLVHIQQRKEIKKAEDKRLINW